MKKVFIIFVLIFCGFANAENNDLCYQEARKNSYNVRDSAAICKGLVGDVCYADARKNYFSIKDAAEICRDVINGACYREAREEMKYVTKTSADLCRGLINNACYIEVRKNVPKIEDAVVACRSTLICQKK